MNINIPPHPTSPHDQRIIISVTWTWTLPSHPTPPHDQRNISVAWTSTLTSHPTHPHPIIKQKQKNAKNTKKTTKHPGALQRPWQLYTHTHAHTHIYIYIYTKSSVISRGDSNTMYAAWLHPWFWLGRIARPLPPRRVQPPILSRVYQTLSRGFVNLLNAKKIADTRHGGMQDECCYFWLLMDVCSVPCLPLCTEKRDEKSGSSLASWYWWYCDSQGWFTVLKVWSALLVWQIPLSIFAAHQRPLAACLDNHGWPYQLPISILRIPVLRFHWGWYTLLWPQHWEQSHARPTERYLG